MNPSEQKQGYAGLDDHGLIRAFLKGEAGAFEVLVNRHKDRLFNLCFWFLGDTQEADDVCQDVFIKIYRSLNGFRFEASFATWSYRIAMNACKNRSKSLGYRIRKWTSQLDNSGALPAAPAVNGAGGGNPHQDLENRERADAIQRALNALPPDKRMVVMLRDMEGLSYDEIAEITHLPAGTVKSRLSRARSDLKKMLAGRL
jgi:RNA polymerase sigma-70 factor (ECF subfamily)